MNKPNGAHNAGNHCHGTEENRMKRNEDSLRDQHQKHQYSHYRESQKGDEREIIWENILNDNV